MKKLIGILLLLVCASASFAQGLDSIGLIANVAADKVQLKWLPSNYRIWMEGVKSGYMIDRTEVKAVNGKWVIVKKETLTTEPLKAWSTERITEEAKTNPEVVSAKVVIAARIMEDNTKSATSLSATSEMQSQKDYLHIMCLLGNLLKNKSSEAMGLYYEDKTAVAGKTYFYEVTLNNSKKIKAITVVNTAVPEVLPKVMGFDYKNTDKSVELYWIQPKHSGYFAYNIYRSTSKGGTFEKVNKDPYIGEIAITADEKRIRYIDSFPEMNKTYYYKVQAINAFEKLSPFTEVLTVKSYAFLSGAPTITSSFSPDNSAIELEWIVPSADAESITSFAVWVADEPFGPMTKVNTKPIDGKTYKYVDQTPGKPVFNYYRVCSYGYFKDSICSLVKEGFLVDSIPPAPPTIVAGICDTNGVVTLHWKKSKERDIYGYRVFRTFYKHHEPIRVTDTTIFDTTFVETVDIKAGWKKIYYAVVAVDQVYNASYISPYFAVSLPDKIPPINGIFTNYEATYSGILLEWKPSPSNDVKYTYIYKKSEYDFQWVPLVKLTGTDAVQRTKLRDTVTQSNVWYEYRLVVEDSSGLLSKDEQRLRVQQPEKDPFPVVTNLRAVMSRENKMVKLSWDFNKQAKGFKIMRSQNGGQVETYEFVPGTKREYYDTWLTTNTEYSYAIIAELPDGRISVMSAVIKVKY